jgi:hypothetical protein
MVVCPECGYCCPGCDETGLKLRKGSSSAEKRASLAKSSPCGKLLAMHDELGHALMEAMWEIDNLPADPDEAISRIFAVTDDLVEAIKATRALDEILD